MKTHVPVVRLHHSEPSLPSLSIQNAGFQQCMAQLGSYMHKIAPAQRTSLMEGLKRHTETETQTQQQQRPEFNLLDAACTDPVCTSDSSREDSSKFPFSSHSPFQPQSCSSPCHDYLTPPSSPWFSPSSFSTYATSPPFPSFTSHFTFPPSLSPPSSNTSLYSFSPTGPHTGPAGPHFPSTAAPRTSPHLTQRDGSQLNSSSSTWRPWCWCVGRWTL